MPIEIGRIEAIFRYPVKSMRGEPLSSAALGWHGLDGDRRFAFRRLDQRGDFPWLTASKLPELVLYTPGRVDEAPHVRAPEGQDLPLFGEELAAQVGRRCGFPVEMMQLRNGIFDDASISAITSATAGEVCRLAGRSAEIRRFRPNIVIRSERAVPFEEDQWVGRVLVFGEGEDAPAVTVTARDVRCAMLNIDPDTASLDPEMMKAAVRANQNDAGVYGAVTRSGRLAVGQRIYLR
jgi:uncharacterized protein YcbX